MTILPILKRINILGLLVAFSVLAHAQTCDTAAINAHLSSVGFSRLFVPTMPCSRYYYYPTTQYGIDAHRMSANLGIPLLVINDGFEDTAVNDALYGQGLYNINVEVWLGITDSGSTYTWRTLDGSPLPAYTNWDNNEPNNLYPNCKVGTSCLFCFAPDDYWCANGENYAVMNADKKWIDQTGRGTGIKHLMVLEVNTCPVIAKPIDTTICLGSPVRVSATASGGTVPYTYTWNPGSLSGQTQTLSPGATSTFTVEVTDHYSCITDSTFTVNVNTNVPVANAGTDKQACPGAIDTLGAPSTSGYTYAWSPAWGLSSTSASNPAFTVASNPRTTAIDTTYIVTATSGGCSTSDTVHVTLYPNINNNFTAGTTSCGGKDVTVSYSGVPSGTAVYTWGFDSATLVSGSGPGAYVISWATPGVKTISLSVSDNGCLASPVSHTVTVYPKPTPVINAVVHALQTTTFSHYQWLENGAPLAGDTARTLLATSNGAYQVVTIDSNGCVDTSAVYNVTGVGISEVSGLDHIRIYPNPSTGTFTIETHNAIGAEMSVTDVLGRLMLKETINTDKQAVDLKDIAAGDYYVNIKLNGGSYTGKIVIAKE